ncbi:ankyrin repeat domain-containing protein [Candidatus Babela massiliensis]|uniref:Ankyrin repeats containing protein n=1 Tax=Candidatus Babela massiliensis TaxID=673862 RepID=V6DFB9_9BACT|nr:ankyrin repeat domain-containing protein [Candidatus Babela massiliensis]CDK30270.1 Ankyrin repeats containing protein [Candidatus Babela massiliensis]
MKQFTIFIVILFFSLNNILSMENLQETKDMEYTFLSLPSELKLHIFYKVIELILKNEEDIFHAFDNLSHFLKTFNLLNKEMRNLFCGNIVPIKEFVRRYYSSSNGYISLNNINLKLKEILETPELTCSMISDYNLLTQHRNDILKKITCLIIFGADINIINKNGKDSLIYVSSIIDKKDNKEFIKILLDYCLDITRKDNAGYTALMYAVYNKNIELIRVLLKKLIDNASVINSINSLGETALMIAIGEDCDESIIKLLLDSSPMLDIQQEQEGYTALMKAIFRDNKKVVKLLIDAKCNLNVQSKDGRTALMWAIYENSEDIVSFILDKNVDVNVQDEDGRTALTYAIRSNNEGIIRLILSKKPSFDVLDKEGKTILMHSVDYSNYAVVKLIVELDSKSINVQDKYGNTALILALKGNKIDIANLLISQGANIDISNYFGERARMLALEHNYYFNHNGKLEESVSCYMF